MTLSELMAANLAHGRGDACRLLHGRGKTLPGLEQVSVDYFPPVGLVTLFAPLEQALLEELRSALQQLAVPQPLAAVVLQERYRDGDPVSVLEGSLPHKLIATEAGLQYAIQVGGRQNLGFFLDMAEARRWLRERASGQRVLNLFAYTCAFSVVALAAGASSVVNLDMSAAALRQGQQNHQRNRITAGAQFLAHDLFRSWGKLRRYGPFDTLIVDPPSRQPGSFVAERDYPRVIRKLPALCAPGAELLLCLNSPHLETAFLKEAVAREAPGLQFVERLPNPPAFEDAEPELSLKVLVYRRCD